MIKNFIAIIFLILFSTEVFAKASELERSVYDVYFFGNKKKVKVLINKEDETQLYIDNNFIEKDLSAYCNQKWKGKKFIKIQSLKSCGLDYEQVVSRQELILQENPFLKPKNVIVSKKTAKKNEIDVIKQADFSAYVNAFAKKRISAIENPENMTFDVFGSANIKSNILEYSFFKPSENEFRRKSINLSRDTEDQLRTFQIGDTDTSDDFYMQRGRIFGLRVSDRQNITLPLMSQIGETEILIKKRARLEIVQNETIIYSRIMEPGLFNLKDIPSLYIRNDTSFILKDENSGEVIKRIDLNPFIRSPLLVKKGLSSLDYSIGYTKASGFSELFPMEGLVSILGVNYKDDPIFSAAHRYGISNQLSSGGFLQAKNDYFLIGAGVTSGSRLGLISIQNGVSFSRFGFGFSPRVDHTNAIGRLNYSFGVSTSFFDYAILGAGESYRDRTKNSAYLNFSANLTKNITTNIGIRSSESIFSQNRSLYTLGLNFNSMKFLGSILGSYNTGTSGNSGSEDRFSVSANIMFRIGEKELLTVATNKTNDTIMSSADVFSRRTFGETALGLNARVSQGSESPTISSASISVDGTRISSTVSGSHNFQDTRSSGAASIGSAIVFADGEFGWSSPIQDGFVIVKNSAELKERESIASINSNGEKTELGALNFVKKVSTDTYEEIKYGLISKDPGLKLNNSSFNILPKRKTGYLVKLTSLRSFSIEGVLVDNSGVPIRNLFGKIYQEKAANPIEFFTTESGDFFAESLTSNKIKIEINGKIKEIRIKDLKNNIKKLGKIVIK